MSEAGDRIMNMSKVAIRQFRRSVLVRAMCLVALGGKCSVCGSTDNLEVDHKDRTKKEFYPTTDRNRSADAILRELEKCQLLCKPCHIDKSIAERGHVRSDAAPCGTISAYARRGCRCGPCRSANAAQTRTRRRRGAPVRAAEIHGLRMYDLGCKCDVCRAAKAEKNRGRVGMRRSRAKSAVVQETST